MNYKNLLVADFDNTYFLEGINYKSKYNQEIKIRIKKILERKNICFIILSGNKLSSIINIINKNDLILPDYIVGSLGTEIQTSDFNKSFIRQFKNKFNQPLKKNRVEKLINLINSNNKILYKQPKKFNTLYKSSFYCNENNFNNALKNKILKLSKYYNLNVKISKCNENSGTERNLV